MSELNRRELFALGAGALVAPAWRAPEARDRKRSLRVAFATDMHVQPDPKAEAGGRPASSISTPCPIDPI